MTGTRMRGSSEENSQMKLDHPHGDKSLSKAAVCSTQLVLFFYQAPSIEHLNLVMKRA